MKPFEWVQPASLAEAIKALEKPGSLALAGGVDLLDRMKERLDAPTRLVSLRKLPDLDGITNGAGNVRIGANVTLATIAAKLGDRLPILAEAAGHAATPQVRAMATIGGNLAQRPRCWYFRSEDFQCRKKGGTECFALAGENEMHALYNNKTCAATHPSTVATALLALGTMVEIVGRDGKGRTEHLSAFFVAPETDVKRETILAPGEIITAVIVGTTKTKGAYMKQVAKQSFDWPIVDCAVALQMDGSKVTHARVVLGAVAPTPLDVSAESGLVGKSLDDATARAAARAIVAKATPLRDNAYKVPIIETVITRTILAARAS